MKTINKLSLTLLATAATASLLFVACGAGQAQTKGDNSQVETASPPPTSEPVAPPATTAVEEPAAETAYSNAGDPCYAKIMSNEQALTEQALAIKAELESLFPGLSIESVKRLALMNTLCDVSVEEVEDLLAEDELGVQYLTLVEALDSGSYRAFTDSYITLPCMIAAHDFDVDFEGSARLKTMVEAVAGAALSRFMPTDAELESIAKNLLGDMMNAFQATFMGEADTELPDGDASPVSCLAFTQQAATR